MVVYEGSQKHAETGQLAKQDSKEVNQALDKKNYKRGDEDNDKCRNEDTTALVSSRGF